MTDRAGRETAPVWWLAAQTTVFGIVAALLGIVANAMFLDAYGSEWLPFTYILIGVAGIALSGAVARSAQSVDLLRLAISVLGSAAVMLGVAWVIVAGGGGAWVSVPLLVVFPILIQLGFVFVGGQAGRLLDIAGIKAHFPRIAAGFPVGAVIGGILGGQLVGLTGRTEDLLLATALAQSAFTALVWATGRRFPTRLRAATVPPPAAHVERTEREPRAWRRLFGRPFVALILGYQVLSALGSQLADFLVLDRATASFPDPADLAGFLAGYTAVMNIVSIGFLVLLAGPLMRRFGLRLGVTANPLVLMAFAFGMIAADALAGGGSVALLAMVSAARIADIALTDGTTRTSINAMYQALPEHVRLAAQTTVEGIGVPVAIAISGVLIILLDTLPAALTATIVVTTLVCVAWTWVALRLYHRYGPALVDAVRRPHLLDMAAGIEAATGDEDAARHLLLSGDLRAMRLGVDLLRSMGSPGIAVELATLADDPRPEVRTAALVALAAGGDERAGRALAEDVRVGATSPDAHVRTRAALALEVLGPADRAAVEALLSDPDPDVRTAALDAVRADDRSAVEPVISALGDARTLTAAASAACRLGDAVVPAMTARLESAASPVPPEVPRLVRALDTSTDARDEALRRHIGHPDRELGLVVIERLIGPDPAEREISRALDDALAADVRHATRVLGALVALGTDGGPGDTPLRSALGDELALIRRRVLAGRVARHGSATLGPVVTALSTPGPHVALALEALEVTLDPAEARQVLPLAGPGLASAERLGALSAALHDPGDTHPAASDLAGWLRDIVEDPDAAWRSAWVTACALFAADARGLLAGIDTRRARALGDPAVDEVLAAGRPASLP
ncbi:MAG: hypothetical protein ABWZ82_08920 [Candidatus Limnocylindrales bacterium]